MWLIKILNAVNTVWKFFFVGVFQILQSVDFTLFAFLCTGWAKIP